jgi:hypothetical protein
LEQQVVWMPLVEMHSLMMMGMPSRGFFLPLAPFSSFAAFSASFIASVLLTNVSAWIFGSSFSIRFK